MTYADLGFTEALEQYLTAENLAPDEIGRVISEHKERYAVKTPTAEYDAELLGNLRFTAEDRYDLPAVGDWVAFTKYDEDKALIRAILPRSSIIERQAVGKKGRIQIIATNIDFGLIVQAVDRDFNLNRLERYLTICHASKVEPIAVLSKIDLLEESELEDLVDQVRQRAGAIEVVPVSNQLPDGYEGIRAIIKRGKTYCLLGSSGVGKSTLLNGLSGETLMETSHISTSVNKGRHTTSHREMFVLEGGGILIDNPGMREVGISDTSGGLEVTFDAIAEFAAHCRFKDCTHTEESGCAVLEAVEEGALDGDAFENYRKMQKERQFFESTRAERKKNDKNLARMIKEAKKVKGSRGVS